MQRSLRAERPIVMRSRLMAKCSAVRSGYLTINSAMAVGEFEVRDSNSVNPADASDALAESWLARIRGLRRYRQYSRAMLDR